MSKHSASRRPLARATNAAPAAPPAGPDSTVQAAWSAAAGRSIRPPFDCMIVGSGRPPSRAAPSQPPQIAGQQRRQGRVDLGRRRALELPERADDLVRERHVDVGQLGRDRRRELAARARDDGRSAAAPPRPPRARTRRPRAPAGAPRRRSARSSGPSGVIRSAAPKRRSGGVSGAGRRRAQPVELGAVLAPERDQVGEAVGGDERRPRAAALEQRVGRDRHPVRERADLIGRRAGPLEHGVRRRRSRLRTGHPGWSAPWRSGSGRRRRARRR